MTYYADLAICTYFDGSMPSIRERKPYLRAIGWLEAVYPFPHGTCDPLVYARLALLVNAAWQPVCFFGWHTCSLCVAAGCSEDEAAQGSSNVFIPGAAYVFAVPELILHYITVHGYAPPEIFCQAVRICPDIGSEPYRRAILQYGSALLREAMRNEPRPVRDAGSQG